MLLNPYRFVTSGGAWTPSEITTELWLDASDADTITESGGSVSQLDDKSGKNNHAVQVSGSKQPTTGVNTLNSLNVLVFDSDFMNLTSQITNIRACVFVTQNLNGSSLSSQLSPIFGEVSTGSHTFIRVNTTDADYDISIDGTISATGNASVNGALSLTSGTNIDLGQTDAQNKSSNIWYVDYDAVQDADYFGRLDSGGAYELKGDIAEFVVLSSIPSEANRQNLEGYLAHKWGLTANLPVGHPYKSSPPTV